MSMHEIEGLIEDSVHLVAASKMTASVKRDFLFNLYNFQAMFDTGYTHFRVIDTLLELNYTYRIPLGQHPDYEKYQSYFDELNVEKTYWLPAQIENEGESVYAKKEGKEVFLYADAGSAFWQCLCTSEILPKSERQAPKAYKTNTLISQLLQEADRQDDIQLMSDWYALLANVLSFELTEEAGFPKNFSEFVVQKEVIEIRQVGLKNNLFSKTKNNNDWGSLATPVLKEIEKEENDIERLFCLKFLLDFKSDEAKLKAAYIKAITPDPKKEAKLQIIPDAVKQHLGNSWSLVWSAQYEYGYQWLYHHQLHGKKDTSADTDVHLYLFLDANTEEFKLLYPKIGVQNGLLNRWQGRPVVHNPESIHFLETIIGFIPEEDWGVNKSLHNMGGWKFSLKSSEKTLKKNTDNFFENFAKYGPELLIEFEKPLFANFQMSLDEALKYREKMQQTHRFFLNQIEVYLVYAIHYFEKGKKQKAYDLAKTAKSMAEEKKHPIKEDWIVTAQSILEGRPKLNELLSFERKYF